MTTYILRSFDRRGSLPQGFRSLAAAKRAARRIFGWQRVYTSGWYLMCDTSRDGKDDSYMALQIAEKPSDLAGEAIDAPVIERRGK